MRNMILILVAFVASQTQAGTFAEYPRAFQYPMPGFELIAEWPLKEVDCGDPERECTSFIVPLLLKNRAGRFQKGRLFYRCWESGPASASTLKCRYHHPEGAFTVDEPSYAYCEPRREPQHTFCF
ncbi:MAG: hypothetical protein ACK5Y2_04225 [Bdellovibrionales bacterium]